MQLAGPVAVSTLSRLATVQMALLFVALLVYSFQGAFGSCQLVRKADEDFTIPGFMRYPILYNVCQDNTEITSLPPSRFRMQNPSFDRRCCGCKPLNVSERTINLSTVARPREIHSFFFYHIVSCQCIQCNSDPVWARRLRYLYDQ